MWESDKLYGPHCRVHDQSTGDFYVGPMEDGKRNGKGRLYDAENDEVFAGEFVNNNKQGDGIVFLRSGEVHKGDFRNGYMEGSFELLTKMTKDETKRMFNNAKNTNDVFISLNKYTQ